MHARSASGVTPGKQNSVQKKTFEFPIYIIVGYTRGVQKVSFPILLKNNGATN